MRFIGAARRQAKRSYATILRKVGMVQKRCDRGGVIILMLHKVNHQYDPLPITITPDLLDQIITEIKQAGYEFIAIDELFDQAGHFLGASKLKFVVTFDDGYLDNYEDALPVLKKHNVPSTIYLSYGHVEGEHRFWYELMTNGIYQTKKTEVDLTEFELGLFNLTTSDEKEQLISQLNDWLKQFNNETRNTYLTTILNRLNVLPETVPVSKMLDWDMVQEMQEHDVNFGSHTLSHPILSKEDLPTIQKEVSLSKQLIEEKIKRPVTGFAYPNGTYDDYNQSVIDAVEQAGYLYACTTNSGINYKDAKPYELKRINLFTGMCTNEKGTLHADFFWAKVTACF